MNPPQLSREDRAVAGCSCGGLQWHALNCTLLDLDSETALRAIADAQAVVRRHGEMLNALLREWESEHHG